MCKCWQLVAMIRPTARDPQREPGHARVCVALTARRKGDSEGGQPLQCTIVYAFLSSVYSVVQQQGAPSHPALPQTSSATASVLS